MVDAPSRNMGTRWLFSKPYHWVSRDGGWTLIKGRHPNDPAEVAASLVDAAPETVRAVTGQ